MLWLAGEEGEGVAFVLFPTINAGHFSSGSKATTCIGSRLDRLILRFPPFKTK